MQLAANNFVNVCGNQIAGGRGTTCSNFKTFGCVREKNSKCSLLVKCGIAEPSGEPAPMGQKTRYSDNFFDKAFMTLFARKMNRITGRSGEVDGYDGFVETSRRVMQGRSPKQQQEAVRQVLLSILPPGAPETFRKLFPPTKWSAEFNAAITVPFFQWLVGPSDELLGTAILFLIFGVISVLALCFIISVVPETKGLTLEEIESKLLK